MTQMIWEITFGVLCGNLLTIFLFSVLLRYDKYKKRRRRSAKRNPAGHRWSRKHAYCVECRTASRPHHARGHCLNCYHVKFINPSRIRREVT